MGMSSQSRLEVAAMVLVENGKVFAAQRKATGEQALLWEFPGGKLEKGETGPEALVREIREELGTRVVVERHLCTVEHQYPSFFLVMHVFIVQRLEGNLVLQEHVASRWVAKHELYSLDWAPADLPVVSVVKQLLFD